MRADYLTYRRGAGVSAWGLVLHLLVAILLLSYGLVSRDAFATASAVFAGLGAVAWLALLIVFDQQRRERIEAMEAQSLAGERAASSVFDRGGEEFRVAARRLAGLFKYFFPMVSIAIALALLGTLAWRVVRSHDSIIPEKHVSSLHMGWGLGLGLGIAAIGFIFARYTSGMAKQDSWSNLRGGASYTVGSAILGAIQGLIQFIDLATADDLAILRILQIAPLVVMGVVGLEILLNFVLNIYRPRRAGEVPRPAFDSRLLGFAAAPDKIAQSISEAINYQLGFEASSGWFYRLLSRSLVPLVGAGLVVMWGLTSLAVIQPHQRGMILRFGRVARADVGPGLHFKLPWPIDRVYVPEYLARTTTGRFEVKDRTTTGVRTLQLATDPPGSARPILWTGEHVGTEVFQLVGAEDRSAGGTRAQDGLNSFALVSVEVPLKYCVEDPVLFHLLAPPEQRDDMLRAVAQRELMLFFQTVGLDDVLGGDRAAISDQVRARIEGAFARLNPGEDGTARGAGVRVLSCALVGAHPPRDNDVAANFEKVIEADQRYQSRLTAARTEEIRQLTAVAGSVDQARAIIAASDRLNAGQAGLSPDAPPTPEEVRLEGEFEALLDNAGGETASIIGTAKAERWQRYMGIRSQAVRFAGQLAAYRAAPEVFRWNLGLEALGRATRQSRVYVTSDALRDLRGSVDLKDRDTGIEVFRPKE